jgi:D-3-phosphoglycerate dehydrogenase
MSKILISDKMSPLAQEAFAKHGLEVDIKTGLSADELIAIIPQYEALAIRSATKVTAKVIAAAKNLKVIARAGIGVDNIDIEAATNNGVIVMNTPFGNSITTAEHAIAMMFAIARKIPQANSSTHLGKWEKSKFMGVELTNKTLGLIGCGNIGAIVAKKSLALQMQVVVYDPFLSEEKASQLNVKKLSLDELFAAADFITLHVPLTKETKNIINEQAFTKIKNTAYIINCARGGLVDEKALKIALDSQQIAGAALDVFEVEPAKDNILFNNDKVIMTPHLGASTKEAQENVAVQVAEQISNFLNNNVIENSLNIPAISPEDAKSLNPYIALGKNLSKFIGQTITDSIKDITITYYGEVAKLNTKPITAEIVKNILANIIEGVNIVNSGQIAKKRGIVINDVVSNEASNYDSYINIALNKAESNNFNISGTLFAHEARITKLNNLRLEAAISNHMLYISNEDKPGLIGEVGQFLGQKNINIANFHLGRNDKNSGKAIALIAVDNIVSQQDLITINNMIGVLDAKILNF